MLHSLPSPLQIYVLFLVFHLLLLPSQPTRFCHLLPSYPDVCQRAVQITACRTCFLPFYRGKLSLHHLRGVCLPFFVHWVILSNFLGPIVEGSSDAQKGTQSSGSHGRRAKSRWNIKSHPSTPLFLRVKTQSLQVSQPSKGHRRLLGAISPCHRPPTFNLP